MHLWGATLDAEHSGTLAVEDEVSTLFTLRTLGERHGASTCACCHTFRFLEAMVTVRYFTEVDEGVRFSSTEFADLIDVYLADPDGWSGHGYTFVRSDKHAHDVVSIRLCLPKTIVQICGLPDDLSCATLGGRNMYLNAKRWLHGSAKSKQPLASYRQYMVSHEMGHILGHEHVENPGRGHPAPIMLQQTLGIGDCIPSTSVTIFDLRR